MDIIGKKIFLKAVNTIANKIELRTDIVGIIEMYKNITYTKKDIIAIFFPNLTQQEETLYSRALQDVIKRSIGKELFDELRRQKCTHHGCKTWNTLAWKGYYNNLVEKEWPETAAKLYVTNSKKWVEAKWIIPWSDEEKKYIRSQKNLWISNKEIANNCNTLFVDINQWTRTSNGVAQRYYKKKKKVASVKI